MRLSHPLATSDQSHVALSSFAESMKKRSNGKVDITIFPADQMGRQKDVGEMIRQGANVIQMTDALFLGEWVPDAAILDAYHRLPLEGVFAEPASAASVAGLLALAPQLAGQRVGIVMCGGNLSDRDLRIALAG